MLYIYVYIVAIKSCWNLFESPYVWITVVPIQWGSFNTEIWTLFIRSIYKSGFSIPKGQANKQMRNPLTLKTLGVYVLFCPKALSKDYMGLGDNIKRTSKHCSMDIDLGGHMNLEKFPKYGYR